MVVRNWRPSAFLVSGREPREGEGPLAGLNGL